MKMRILVVDDNRDTIRTYVKALRRRISPNDNEILEVEHADTYQLAVERLNNDFFEILVVDLRIPGPSGEEWGGFEIISESTRLDQLRPIIVISGYGNLENIKKSFRKGVLDFIEKSDEAVDDLIQAVRKAINNRREKILRSGNPFTPMSGSEPFVFAGRNNELEIFEQKLYRAIHSRYCEHFLILGQWGIGKSTLLKEYKRICQSRGYAASLVTLEPLQPATSAMEAARSFVESVLRDLPYQINQISFKKLLGFFDSVGINFLGTGLQLSRHVDNQEISVQAFLHDFLIKLWEDLSNKTDFLVILIDELENFMSVPEIILLLRTTLSMDSFKQANILLGLASTKDSWIEFTAPQKHHPLSRFFLSTVELKPLSYVEVSEIVHRSLNASGIHFSEAIIEQIFQQTNGHPFEIQLLCYHLFNNQLAGHVTQDTWNKALQETLNDLGIAVFERWLNQLDDEEYQVLNTICASETPISIIDIKEKADFNSLNLSFGFIEEQLVKLANKQIVSKKRSKSTSFYYCTDNMFKAYFLVAENL